MVCHQDPDGSVMKLYESKAWLHKRYIIERKGIIEMAREAGCSHMTIQRALDRHGIARRS